MKFFNKNQSVRASVLFSLLASACFFSNGLLAKDLNQLCKGTPWGFKKDAAILGQGKSRVFYLTEHSLVWCAKGNKFVGKTDYYKMTGVQQNNLKIRIRLNQMDRGRGPLSPLTLTAKKASDGQSFVVELHKKIQESLAEYNCNRKEHWVFKKKGAYLLSRTMTRALYLGEKSLYWCDGRLVKGYHPYGKMGAITNSNEEIRIEVVVEHRGRAKDNPMILYPVDQLQLMEFVARLKSKKARSLVKKVHKVLSSSAKRRPSISNQERLANIATSPSGSAKQRFKRGAKKAKIIGKGLAKLERQGLKGKALESDFWQEALRRGQYINYGEDKEVVYLNSKEDRAPFKVSFSKVPGSNRVRLIRRGKIYQTGYSNIFVISPDKVMYAGSSIIGEFHHSSFLAGSAVLAAGEFKTNDNGEIEWISNRSGHYKPGVQQTINALKFFKEKGVDLNKIRYREGFKPRGTNAQRYLNKIERSH